MVWGAVLIGVVIRISAFATEAALAQANSARKPGVRHERF